MDTLKTIEVRNYSDIKTLTYYLPRNYWVDYVRDDERGPVAIVRGHDDAGWTAEGYVIPRLQSGLMAAHLVTHP